MSEYIHRRCSCGTAFTTRITSRDKCDECVNYYSVHKHYPVGIEAPSLTEEQRDRLANSMPETVTQLADGTPVFHHGTEKLDI